MYGEFTLAVSIVELSRELCMETSTGPSPYRYHGLGLVLEGKASKIGKGRGKSIDETVLMWK
jgi:hypothetical protein